MIRFRRMQQDDLALVLDLERKIFKDAWSDEHFRNEINNYETSYPFVMIQDQVIVGYGVVLNLVEEIQINNVAVIPEVRGQGLGSTLVQHILDTFPEHKEAWLEVRASNQVAIHLYEKFNFIPVVLRKTYYRDGENAVMMRRISA